MKRVTGAILLFICIAFFAGISEARPVVDTNNQQQEDSSSGKNTDFFFHWRFWWPLIRPRPWPISPAPNGAPHYPKFPFPFPWVPGPKGSKIPNELEAASSSVESSSEGAKNPDFFFGWRPFWGSNIFHHPWSPAPHGAPTHKPFLPFPWIRPHFPIVPPPKSSKGVAELKASSDNDDHNIDAAVVDTEKCWSPLAEIANCVDDIMGAFSSGKVEINSACCAAIKNLESNNCMEKTIGSFNNHRFTNAITDHCSSI